MKIRQILDKIDDNQLFVPAFQREYVWKRRNVKNLVDSLIKEYPTGTMLTWETNEPPELKGGWKYNPKQGSVKVLLDGQQRITSLYFLIKDKIPPYYQEKEIHTDPRGLYINIQTMELQYYKKTHMQNNPYWVNITDIFKGKVYEHKIVKTIKEKDPDITEETEDRIHNNFKSVGNILDREFLEQEIPVEARLKDAINIFYIVNDSGVNLTDAELALAQISGYWPEARELFKNKLDQMKEQGFVFNLDFIIYCLLGVLHTMGSDMTKLHDRDNRENLIEAWDKLDKEVLDYVVNLLRSHAYVDHTDEINSVYALVPIVVFIYHHGADNISEERIKKIVKWFYYSQARQRYVGQLPQKLDKDLKTVVNEENPFDELIGLIQLERDLEIHPDEFIGVGISHALYSLMKWYFKSRGAVCLTTGVQIRKNMGKKYALEWDHIFPYSILKEMGYNLNNKYKYALAQEITNRAILTQTANRTKTNKLPQDYLKGVKEKFPSALQLQSIPEKEELWKTENYEEFLQARREMLADELNNFLEDLTKTEEAKAVVTIDELISEGESNELEFKSSMRWDYRNEEVNKQLENVILKSVAAFGNSAGGKLIIGVDDSGEILGLERDYASLHGGRDQFEQHLRNLVNNAFGKQFAASSVHFNFHEFEDSEVCLIDVRESNNPLYVETTDKNGQKSKKFYVRSGNTTQELDVDEVGDYIKTHFK